MKITFKYLLTIIIPILTVTGLVYATSKLTPPVGTPVATGYTLSDIYTKLTANTNATERNHSLSTTTSVAETFHTLNQIYDAVPTIDATKVLAGNSYLGVAGTALLNLWNGTGVGFTGGSQADGGVDDYNNAGAFASGAYSKGWTQCTSGDTPVSYCQTGDAFADVKDNSTGLIWSLRCKDSGCSTMTETATSTYTWNSSGVNNNSRTASQLCSDHSGWFLPSQKQLMQAYIDGSYGNIDSIGVSGTYWTATTCSFSTSTAWSINLSGGSVYSTTKTVNTLWLRCVRSAI